MLSLIASGNNDEIPASLFFHYVPTGQEIPTWTTELQGQYQKMLSLLPLSLSHTHMFTQTHTRIDMQAHMHTHTLSLVTFHGLQIKPKLFTWLTKGSDELPGVQLHLWPLSFSPPDRLSFLQIQKAPCSLPHGPWSHCSPPRTCFFFLLSLQLSVQRALSQAAFPDTWRS